MIDLKSSQNSWRSLNAICLDGKKLLNVMLFNYCRVLKNGDLELDLFIYQLLIEYYTNQEDLPSLCRCQSELIEFLCQQ